MVTNTGQGNYENENVTVIFNRDILINETESIANCSASVGILSDETIVGQHPWVSGQAYFEPLQAVQIVVCAMGTIYENGYYRTAFELQKGVGICFDVGKVNREETEKVLSKPWAVDGKNFSERIWGSRPALLFEVFIFFAIASIAFCGSAPVIIF